MSLNKMYINREIKENKVYAEYTCKQVLIAEFTCRS